MGKVLRLNPDGSVPTDNPFVGQEGAQEEVWSLGHRNVQSLAFHPTTGELWEAEFGPKNGDELNRIEPGDRESSYIYLKLTGRQGEVDGAGGRMPASGPLDDATIADATATITGTDDDDNLGNQVHDGAFDINGDGFDDLVIGAYRAEPNGVNSGRTYVVFGKDDANKVNLLDVAMGVGGFRIDGEAMGDFSGFSVQGGADINGDDLDDVVLGAFRANGGAPDSGRAYVVFGRQETDPVSLSDIAFGMGGGFAISGVSMQDLAGTAVDMTPDMNDDGLDEVIIGAFRADPMGESSGTTYVVFGKESPVLVELSEVENGSGGFAITGEAESDFSGFALAGLDDVNGDGRGDLAIGAWRADPNGDSSGRAYVVFGTSATDTISLASIAGGTGGFRIDGESASDHAGIAIGNAGDVNGDQLSDLIVGASGWANGEQTGRAYVIFGKENTDPVVPADLAGGQGGFVIQGEDGETSLAGRAVDGAGDANGDGFDDLIIGAYNHKDSTGRSYVVFGGQCQP